MRLFFYRNLALYSEVYSCERLPPSSYTLVIVKAISDIKGNLTGTTKIVYPARYDGRCVLQLLRIAYSAPNLRDTATLRQVP